MFDLFNKKKLQEKNIKINKQQVIIAENEEEIDDLKRDVNNLLKQTENLIKSNNTLTEENQKLIEWIEKIINEVGVKTPDRNEGYTITIPYYKETKIYKANDWLPQRERKDIIIPSIRYTKIEHKEEK